MADQPGVAEGFGDRVRGLREAKGLTQTLLGREVGVALSAVTDWETGKRLPRDPIVLVRLASVLGCSLDYLLLNAEGEHELVTRRLRELLEELDQSRRHWIRIASPSPKEAGIGAIADADADVQTDTRTDTGAARTRGKTRGA